MRIHLISSFVSLLLLSGCLEWDREEPEPAPIDQLPPATRVGAETWGALINGEAVYETSGYYSSLEERDFDDFTIYLGTREDDWGAVDFTIQSAEIKPGRFDLVPGNTDFARYLDAHNSHCFYDGPDLIDGWLEITRFDPTDNTPTISGRFAFTSVKEGCDTLRVTDGRFDIQTHY